MNYTVNNNFNIKLYYLYEISWKYFCMLRNTYPDDIGYFEKDTFSQFLFHLLSTQFFNLIFTQFLVSYLNNVYCVSMSERMQKNRILTNNHQELKTRNTRNKRNVNSIKGIPHTNLTLIIHK